MQATAHQRVSCQAHTTSPQRLLAVPGLHARDGPNEKYAQTRSKNFKVEFVGGALAILRMRQTVSVQRKLSEHTVPWGLRTIHAIASDPDASPWFGESSWLPTPLFDSAGNADSADLFIQSRAVGSYKADSVYRGINGFPSAIAEHHSIVHVPWWSIFRRYHGAH